MGTVADCFHCAGSQPDVMERLNRCDNKYHHSLPHSLIHGRRLEGTAIIGS